MLRRVALLVGLALLLGPAVATVQASSPDWVACRGLAPATECTVDQQITFQPDPSPTITVCTNPFTSGNCHPFPNLTRLVNPTDPDMLTHPAGFSGLAFFGEVTVTASSDSSSVTVTCGPFSGTGGGCSEPVDLDAGTYSIDVSVSDGGTLLGPAGMYGVVVEG